MNEKAQTYRKILVTGGTGTLGSHLVPLLRDAGVPVRVLSRHAYPTVDGIEYVACDLYSAQGQDAALDGVDAVVHLAGGPKGDDVTTRNIVEAAARAGVRHFVLISVIGADTLPIGYFRRKLAAERIVAESGVPWTVLRAAQFHDLAFKTAEAMGKLPVLPAPRGVRWQPVDSREVAARLAELTLGEPAGLAADIAGPRVYELSELCGGYLKARGKHRIKLPVPLPGKVGRVYRSGGNLTLAGATTGTRTWEAFLGERLGA